MSDVNSFSEAIISLPHMDVDSLVNFIDDMCTARTSSYFTDEKRAAYRALDIDQVNSFLNINRNTRTTRNSGGLRISLARDRIRHLPVIPNDQEYF